MIIRMNSVNMKDYSKLDNSFVASSKIIPTFRDNVWSYTVEKLSKPYIKQYQVENIDDSYIQANDKIVFLYYIEDSCIGRVKIRSNWNEYALIEDIAVTSENRQNGVGTALINEAIAWAKEKSFCGVMVETQDINVSACKFYENNHFVLGSIDTMLYSNLSTAQEVAVFWYYKFH